MTDIGEMNETERLEEELSMLENLDEEQKIIEAMRYINIFREMHEPTLLHGNPESLIYKITQKRVELINMVVRILIERIGAEKELVGAHVFNKIKSEIEERAEEYSLSREGAYIDRIEWSDRLIKESDVLAIIDKYKQEEQICK